MAKSKSSRRWLDRHFSDDYVKLAQQEGYRSRAAFKLLEIQDKDRVLHQGMTVVDLGAAPGGWSQVARRLVGRAGGLWPWISCPWTPLPDVTFVLGDFREDGGDGGVACGSWQGRRWTLSCQTWPQTLVESAAVDQPRAIYLCELALDLARKVLKPKGTMVVKAFQGEGFDAYVRQVRAAFAQVAIRKPEASRSESREVYLVAKEFCGPVIEGRGSDTTFRFSPGRAGRFLAKRPSRERHGKERDPVGGHRHRADVCLQ